MTKYLPQYLQIKRHILENIIKKEESSTSYLSAQTLLKSTSTAAGADKSGDAKQ